MCYAISLTNSCPTKLPLEPPQEMFLSEIVIYPGLREDFTKQVAVLLDFVQIPPPLYPQFGQLVPLFFERRKRRFERHSK